MKAKLNSARLHESFHSTKYGTFGPQLGGPGPSNTQSGQVSLELDGNYLLVTHKEETTIIPVSNVKTVIKAKDTPILTEVKK